MQTFVGSKLQELVGALQANFLAKAELGNSVKSTSSCLFCLCFLGLAFSNLLTVPLLV